jgi:hypothetical protein
VSVGGVTLSAPNYIGDRRELERTLIDAVSRDGALRDAIATGVVRSSGARDGAR